VLVNLIRDTVLSFRDEDLWTEMEEKEERHRELLSQTSKRWEEVVEHLEG